jgi:hypothetical protein
MEAVFEHPSRVGFRDSASFHSGAAAVRSRIYR